MTSDTERHTFTSSLAQNARRPFAAFAAFSQPFRRHLNAALLPSYVNAAQTVEVIHGNRGAATNRWACPPHSTLSQTHTIRLCARAYRGWNAPGRKSLVTTSVDKFRYQGDRAGGRQPSRVAESRRYIRARWQQSAPCLGPLERLHFFFCTDRMLLANLSGAWKNKSHPFFWCHIIRTLAKMKQNFNTLWSNRGFIVWKKKNSWERKKKSYTAPTSPPFTGSVRLNKKQPLLSLISIWSIAVKMATGSGWQQQYYCPPGQGKFTSSSATSVPFQSGIAMEYTQDLHLKMSKKIAQLTKVSTLNSGACLSACLPSHSLPSSANRTSGFRPQRSSRSVPAREVPPDSLRNSTSFWHFSAVFDTLNVP